MYLIAYDLFCHCDYDEATGLLVAFACYLRVGNLCRLSVNDTIIMGYRRGAYLVTFPLFVAQLFKRLVGTRMFREGDNESFMPCVA